MAPPLAYRRARPPNRPKPDLADSARSLKRPTAATEPDLQALELVVLAHSARGGGLGAEVGYRPNASAEGRKRPFEIGSSVGEPEGPRGPHHVYIRVRQSACGATSFAGVVVSAGGVASIGLGGDPFTGGTYPPDLNEDVKE